MKVKDTGNRTKLSTGSHKDMAKGRGRYDLLPLRTLSTVYNSIFPDSASYFLDLIHEAMITSNNGKKLDSLHAALQHFILDFLQQPFPKVVQELAVLYEAGAEKYAERDWEKGRPMEIFINSTLRHFFQYLNKETDENHGIAVVWNLISCIDTIRRMPSLAYTAPTYVEDREN